MTEEKIHNDRSGSWWALSPLFVFLCLYLVTSILVNDFYKVPITVAFLVSSCYAIAITRGLTLDQRIYQFSVGAANKNINPEKPDVPLNKNDAFQKVQKRRVQEKR